MAETTRSFLRKLRRLNYTYGRLLRSIPSRELAEQHAQDAYDEVILTLQDPILRSALGQLIAEAHDQVESDGGNVADRVLQRQQELMREEAADAQLFGIKRVEMERVFAQLRRHSDDMVDYVESIEELESLLKDLHQKTVITNRTAMQKPRRAKKSRRRDVTRGTSSALIGSAIIAANTKIPATFVVSYALGGSELLKAVRDFIGEPVDRE